MSSHVHGARGLPSIARQGTGDRRALKTLDKWFAQAGYTNRRVYVDCTGPRDTVVYQWECESLDQYFTMERGTFIEPDQDIQALIAAMNSNARSGNKVIYEVVP